MMSAATRCGPRSSGSTSIAPKDANSGTQASTNTVVEMSRVKEFGSAVLWCPSSRQTMATRTVATNAASTPSVPSGQLNQMMAWPPMSIGHNSRLVPAARNRLTTSHVATAIAAATSGTHRCGAKYRIATMSAPRLTPTPIAAGRLRPALILRFAASWPASGVPGSERRSRPSRGVRHG